ncbi:MAG: UbiA family prenyltransferase [Pirellulaceae bacterium]
MNSESEAHPKGSSRAAAYLRLFRIPNLFTAWADILMGFLVVHQGFTPLQPLVFLLIASACIYTAGMVLNDVYDIEIDRVERPTRPLPAGEISLAQASRLGYLLLVVGVAAAAASGAWAPAGALAWRGGCVALILALCVLLYDGFLKKTPVAPWVMGSCRFLNVLLGMSCAVVVVPDALACGYLSHQWMIAGGFGCYIAGVTWFARTEARVSSRWQLAAGVLVMTGGLLMLAWFPAVMTGVGKAELAMRPNIVFLLLMLLGGTIIYRCFLAVCEPIPARVQMAVKHCLQSLIVLDAAVAASVAGLKCAVVVLALLVPMVVLGQWFRST